MIPIKIPIKIPIHIIESISAFRDVTNNYKLYLSDDLIICIYAFIISDYYATIINKFCINYMNIKKSIKTVIHACLENRATILISDKNIKALQYLINTNISRKYDLHFWANILHILSSRLHWLRFQHRYESIGLKTSQGKKIISVLDLWLQLCKKFNFKIFLQTKQSLKYIRVKCIPRITEYDKYVCCPMIVQPFSDINIIVDTEFARNNLQNLLITL